MSHALTAHAALSREVTLLRQHVAWLNGTLHRLGDLQALASTIDGRREFAARLDYARAAYAASQRRWTSIGSADRPPSLEALIVGQAMAREPAEQATIAADHARTAATGRPLLAVAWCDFHGRIGVDIQPPPDELHLVAGQAHVLWHWIEALAVRAITTCPVWLVPGFDAGGQSIEAKSDACRAFAAALEDAGRSVECLLARPDARATA